jgi:hypothetical protein
MHGHYSHVFCHAAHGNVCCASLWQTCMHAANYKQCKSNGASDFKMSRFTTVHFTVWKCVLRLIVDNMYTRSKLYTMQIQWRLGFLKFQAQPRSFLQHGNVVCASLWRTCTQAVNYTQCKSNDTYAFDAPHCRLKKEMGNAKKCLIE